MVHSNTLIKVQLNSQLHADSLRSSPRDLPQKNGCCALVRNTQITMHVPTRQVILN